MSKMKVMVVGSALGAAILAGPVAAATTGTVSIASEYMFRGVVSEGGAAVQGSLDWADEAGLYAGTWASNSAPAGGTELDLYGGYKFKLTETMEMDIGAIYYFFTEEDEIGEDYSYPEIYAGVSVGNFGAKVYYTNDFFGVDEASTYISLGYTHPLSETLGLAFAVGNQSGDGADLAYGDSVTDYSVTLKKSLDNGFAFGFGIVNTDLDASGVPGTLAGDLDDDVKVVVSLSKGFDL